MVSVPLTLRNPNREIKEGVVIKVGPNKALILSSVKVRDRDIKHYEEHVILASRTHDTKPFIVWNLWNRPESTVVFQGEAFATKVEALVRLQGRVKNNK